MDKKKGILGYLSQVFMIYGITIVLLNIFSLLFGEDARLMSTIFSLGGKGISISTMMQFLLAITLIVTLRFVLMTDFIIKKMPITIRIVLMFAGALVITVTFIFLCGWFPSSEPKAWIMFVICFAISAVISTVISVHSERQENKKLEEALKKYKEEQ